MVNISYFDKYVQLIVKSDDGSVLPIDKWLFQMDKPMFFNVINDLIVNGTASIEEDKVTILYEDLSQLDEFEHSTLKLPDLYPFDIFIDTVGSGLKDLNLKLRYSFQDFAHKNGSGNILFSSSQLKGGYLQNDSEYLLNSSQFQLINKIDEINSSIYSNSNDVLKAVSNFQSIAQKLDAFVGHNEPH